MNRTGKRNVDDPANMHMPDFCTLETEFSPAKAVGMNRDTWPSADFVFEHPQKVHYHNPLLPASMPEYDRSIHGPHFSFLIPKNVTALAIWPQRYSILCNRPDCYDIR